MSDKTSYRRKNIKPRDPMATDLENPIYRQRRVERRRHQEPTTAWDEYLDKDFD